MFYNIYDNKLDYRVFEIIKNWKSIFFPFWHLILKVTSGKELVDTPFWSNFILLRKNQLNLKFCWRKFTYYGKKKSAELPKNNSGGENAACTIDNVRSRSAPICRGYLVSDGAVFASWINEECRIFRKNQTQFDTIFNWVIMYISVFFMLL